VEDLFADELAVSCAAVADEASSELRAEWLKRVRVLDDERIRSASAAVADTALLQWLVWKVATRNEVDTAAAFARSLVGRFAATAVQSVEDERERTRQQTLSCPPALRVHEVITSHVAAEAIFELLLRALGEAATADERDDMTPKSLSVRVQ